MCGLGKAVAEGGGFSGVEVGEGHDRGGGPGFDQGGKLIEERSHPREQEIKRFADAEGGGGVYDVHRSHPQVDYPPPDFALFGEGFDFSHHVVLDVFLDFVGAGDVNLVGVGAEVVYLGGGDEAKFGLDFGEGNPKFAPGAAFVDFAPEGAHVVGAVAPGVGGEVGGVVERHGVSGFQVSGIRWCEKRDA